MKPRILTSALVGVLMFLSAGLAAASPASAAATAGADRTIHYQGATFRVPASWPVVDLDRAPNTCVRFDRHAVYLGRSGARQDCPAHLMGRTEAILVQPAGHGAAPAAQENTSAREITVSTAELTVTASYGTDRATVQAVLDSAGLPRVRRTQPRSATPAAPAVAAAAISASTTSYTGKGFDLCQAPDSSTMGTWKASSPYGAIGIYLGGVNRTCDQPNLTSGWVAQQASIGWHFIPLYVGYQAPGACQNTCTAIPSPSQGTADAEDAIAQLSALGFPAGSPVYMDIEPYSPASYSSLVMGYLSAWTTQLHARGYLSGVYGNGSGVISDLVANYGSATMPDLIDFAIWPGSGSTSTSDPTIPDNEWANHQRIHQYAGDITETYGGISLGIDSDYLDVQQAGPGSGWDDFGDGRQNPAIGREANGAMIAFAVSPDQQGLYYREQSAPNGGWGTWQQLGGAVGGLPVVGRDPDGRLELFVLGPGKSSIQHIWQTAPGGGWSSWDPNFGGPAAGLTVGQNADGRLEVFALAPGGANISHIWQTAPNGGWSSWDATFGGPAGGTPVVGHEADGRMAVFVLGSNGNSVAVREQVAPSAGWGAWNGSFGGPAGGLTVSQNADGRLEVFALAPGGANISHIWQTAPNGGWSSWDATFGGPAGGTPVVGHEADGRMAVFVLGPNGNSIAVREQVAPSAGWGAWNGSFGTAAATVNVSHNADGRMEVFALAPGGANISHIWQTAPNGGWSAWNGDGTFGGPAWVGP